MKAVGIIAEYNPFHNGHAYQVEQARQITQANVVIAIMSGNFTQRGLPAICDKWERTQVALANGVDIVVELPTRSAVQAADYFGYEGVKIAAHLGVSMLSFGVEAGSAEDFERLAQVSQQLTHSNRFDLSYHDNMMHAIQSQNSKGSVLLQRPNNQLAFSYAKAIAKQQVDMDMYPIKRLGSQHTDKTFGDGSIASATAIRRAIYDGKNVANYVPVEMVDALAQPVMMETFWQLIRYALLSQSAEELRLFYQVDEGIEYRLKDCAKMANTYQSFVDMAKHKRFKAGRIQRMLLYILLRVTKESMRHYFDKPIQSVRVLGSTANGVSYLKTLNKEKYVTQLKGVHRVEYHDQLCSDHIYELLMHTPCEQNFKSMIRGLI